ncbi:MAG: ABC transporter permease [Planctomycetota bacterium]|nr:ABC transporter permease [Planctomycetota bacterium]
MREIVRLPLALVLLFYQSVALALAEIWSSKLRALLTTLGILIGVAAVTSVIALIDGMRKRVVAEYESFGANKLFISPNRRESDRRSTSWAKLVFEEDCFDELLERCPSVSSYTRAAGFGALPILTQLKRCGTNDPRRGETCLAPGVEEGEASLAPTPTT